MNEKEFQKLDDLEKTCVLCNKVMTLEEFDSMWEWAEDPAHSECVILKSSFWCEDCGYYSTEDERCRDCDEPMKPLTLRQKANLIKVKK